MEFLKWLVLRSTPEFLLWRLKASHYVRFLRSLPPSAEPEFGPVSSLVGPGDSAVDVGANFGIYTRLLSVRVGPGGEVHSFEPVPHTFRVLASCVSKLRMTNVRLYPLALSDRAGEAVMTSPFYREGGSNYYKARIAESGGGAGPGRRYPVRLRRMDDVLAGARGPIRFIKIDVEGHELPVLRGAGEVLARWKPALLVEVSRDPDDPSSTGAELFRLLEGHGYGAYRLSEGRLIRRAPGDRAVNYFFLTPSQAEQAAGSEAAGVAAAPPGAPPTGGR